MKLLSGAAIALFMLLPQAQAQFGPPKEDPCTIIARNSPADGVDCHFRQLETAQKARDKIKQETEDRLRRDTIAKLGKIAVHSWEINQRTVAISELLIKIDAALQQNLIDAKLQTELKKQIKELGEHAAKLAELNK